MRLRISCSAGSFVRPWHRRDNHRNLYQSLFFQDDIKLTDRVTLNLGARYEQSRPWHDLVGRSSTSQSKAITRKSGHRSSPDAPPGLLYRGDPGVPEDGTLPDMNNVSGRFGIAWDVTGDGKTSIRGGGGMFYDTHLAGDYNNGGVNAPPWSIRVNAAIHDRRDRSRIHIAAAPTSPRFSTTTKTKTKSSEPTNAPFPRPVLVESFDEVFDTPLTYNYNLAFEREVATGWMARAAYVGSTATKDDRAFAQPGDLHAGRPNRQSEPRRA